MLVRLRARIRPLFPAIALMVSLATYSLLLVPKQPMLEMAAWGLCVFASMLGYGVLAARIAFPEVRVAAPTLTVLGAGVHVAMGSVFTAAHAMSKTLGVIVVLTGVGFAVPRLSQWLNNGFARSRRRVRYARKFPWFALIAILPALLIASAYLHGSSIISLNPYDDELAYMTFPKQMVETGSFADPFSLRRVASYGGQSYLHALLISAGNLEYLGILDRGIFFAVSLQWVRSFTWRGRRPSFAIVLAILSLLIFLQNISINCASHYSGLAGFLVFYSILAQVELELKRRRHDVATALRAALALVLVCSFLATLRQNFLPVVAIATTVCVVSVLRERFLAGVVMSVAVAAGSFAALFGWILQIRESSGTAFFPLQPGFLRPAFTMRSPSMTGLDEVRFFWEALTWREPFPGWPLAFCAILAVPRLRRHRPTVALFCGSVVGFVLLVSSFTLSNAENFARYSFPFVFATMITALLIVLSEVESRETFRRSSLIARAHVGVALLLSATLLLGQSRTFFWWTYRSTAHHVTSGAWRPHDSHRYARMQATIPESATVVVLTDEPYKFNYKRNTIRNLDIPGAISPSPGLPFFGPVEQVESYFAGQSIRYISFIRAKSSRANYVRPYWFARFWNDDEIWRRHAPYYVYMFDALEALSTKHRVLFEERGLVMLDLQQPPEAPSGPAGLEAQTSDDGLPPAD